MATQVSIPPSTLDPAASPPKRNRRSILASMSPSSEPRIQINGHAGATENHAQGPHTASPKPLIPTTESVLPVQERQGISNRNGNANGLTPPISGAASPLRYEVTNGDAGHNGHAAPYGTTRPSQAMLNVPTGGLGKLRRRMSNISISSHKSQDDRSSIHSTFSSHRDAISSFIRRRNTRGGSAPPEVNFVDDDHSIAGAEGGAGPKRRSKFHKRTPSSISRMKLAKFGGKGKKNGDVEETLPSPLPSATASTGSIVNGGNSMRDGSVSFINSGPSIGSEELGEEPRKATRSKILRDSYLPAGYPISKGESNGLSSEIPATEIPAARFKQSEEAKAAPESTVPDSPHSPTTNGSAPLTEKHVDPSRVGSVRGKDIQIKEESFQPQQQGYFGAAAATVTGLFGFGTAQEISNANDDYYSDSDGSDDDFHDAELGDINEEEEEDEEKGGEEDVREEEAEEKEQQTPQRPLPRSPGSRESAYSRAGRSRGLSESSGKDKIIAAQANGESSFGKKKAGSPEQMDESSQLKAGGSSNGPARLKGTASAKRRAGSAPVLGTPTEEDGPAATPQDAKAKKETPADVNEKSARVAKMTFDDVKEDTEEMRDDIEIARGALHLFLNSRMLEAEEIIRTKADCRLYYALGYCLIATMKGFMTFEPEDLATAISYCKDTMHIAHLLRRPSHSVIHFGRFVRGAGHSPSSFAAMTLVQRHAELVYVEAQLLKSCLGIVYSGDFFGFVAEALHMRNAYGVYRSLAKYVDTADSKAPGKHDDSIDEDFRSGVYLGNGLITMFLGLLPGKILGLMSAFGYEGDTKAGLETLMRSGGWKTSGQDRPAIGIRDEGIRRSVCDMGMLLFHLVVSVFVPVTGVNISFADRILHYHLKRYPNGVFFLYFSGRLYSTQARCEKAIKQYAAARDAQEEYIQLKHISWWDASLCHMSLAQWSEAQSCFEILLKESNWSKCVYTYGVAANMAQTEEEAAQNGTGKAAKRKANSEAAQLFVKVPGLMQRIAGKSIPMEKFVAKKASKFNKQGRLLLPAVEFSYIYHCLSNAPRYALADEQLIMISDALVNLNAHASKPSSYHSGEAEFWDDYCLAHFLRGVVLRHIATPEAHAKADARDEESVDIPRSEAQDQALLSFQTVLDNGHRITTDHYIIYFSHYELGRLHADKKEYKEARRQLELVLGGKLLEDKGARKGNHKYGMQNMALLRSNGALNNLKQQGH